MNKNYPPKLSIRVRKIDARTNPIPNSDYHDTTPEERNPTMKETPQDNTKFAALQKPKLRLHSASN
jgi:hypothetical protein